MRFLFCVPALAFAEPLAIVSDDGTKQWLEVTDGDCILNIPLETTEVPARNDVSAMLTEIGSHPCDDPPPRTTAALDYVSVWSWLEWMNPEFKSVSGETSMEVVELTCKSVDAGGSVFGKYTDKTGKLARQIRLRKFYDRRDLEYKFCTRLMAARKRVRDMLPAPPTTQKSIEMHVRVD